MTTNWTKVPDNTSSWTNVPKAASAVQTTTISPGMPIGLLLALTYSTTSTYSTDIWTKVPTNAASWTKVPKAT